MNSYEYDPEMGEDQFGADVCLRTTAELDRFHIKAEIKAEIKAAQAPGMHMIL